GPRPGARGRRARRHAPPGSRRYDDDRGDARDGLRAGGRRLARLLRRRRGRRERQAKGHDLVSPARANESVPLEGALDPQVGLLNVLRTEQLLARALLHYVARLEHVSTVGELQRGERVLL